MFLKDLKEIINFFLKKRSNGLICIFSQNNCAEYLPSGFSDSWFVNCSTSVSGGRFHGLFDACDNGPVSALSRSAPGFHRMAPTCRVRGTSIIFLILRSPLARDGLGAGCEIAPRFLRIPFCMDLLMYSLMVAMSTRLVALQWLRASRGRAQGSGLPFSGEYNQRRQLNSLS